MGDNCEMTTRKLQENRNRERVVKQRNWNAPMNEFGVNDFQKLYKINFKLTVDIVQLIKHQALSRAKRCVQPKWHGLNVQNCRKCKYYSSLLLRYVQASCVCVCVEQNTSRKKVCAHNNISYCVYLLFHFLAWIWILRIQYPAIHVLRLSV